MKHIIKSKPFPEFEAWKEQYQLTEEDLKSSPIIENWKNLSGKEKYEFWGKLSGKIKKDVRDSLVQEQGFICCYCQQKIDLNENTIIEHFIARDTQPEKMFDYNNILACCDGGDKERTTEKKQGIKKTQRTPLYCDREKSNDSISISPLDENCESHFSYEFNADSLFVSIIGISTEGQDTIQKLNLDVDILKSERGKAVAGILFDENGDYISPEEAQNLIVAIKQRKANNQFEPFCVVLEHILKIFS